MKLTGDIRKIGTKREDKFQDIVLEINRLEYITHKKDGNYFQAFDLEVELEKPLIITGDRLAKKNIKPSEEGEILFDVYDKAGDAYVLNKNLELEIIVAYDSDEDLLILSSVYYAEMLPPKEFEAFKKEYEKTKAFKNRKGKNR
ncbi:hypothetical protein I5M27_07200 [Adhaeribacter sp. BT258]|uniref:Uncharacterized protein n=1 Tax=Adhaeribacter terrigena TaxID=2793070 RepID=A0ABS1C050_9BACT|nr:hypothetical protein [Adhaeribacter terrigena]MBK0402767.1 hypothetical protein [Adhaeribacter terrigena]